MADLQKLPIQGKEIFGQDIWVTPTVEERLPNPRSAVQFTPYRVFRASGEYLKDVEIRVEGLENSTIPTRLSRANFEGLVMGVQSIQSRGKTKRVIGFTAKKMSLVK